MYAPPTDKQQCQGMRKKWMEKAGCLEKGIGFFHFKGGFESEMWRVFSPQASVTVPALFSQSGVLPSSGKMFVFTRSV